MKFILQPWRSMLIILASWVNRQHQQKIGYVEMPLAVLNEQFGNKRILLTDDQRKRIAVNSEVLGRKPYRHFSFTLFAIRSIPW
jgi:hypothetical protein